jgi:hypothetical protein
VLTARLHCRICLHLLFAWLSIDCQNFVHKEKKNPWKSRVLDALRVPVWHWHSRAHGLHVFAHCLIAFLSKSFCNPLYDTNGRGVIKCKAVYQLTHSLKRCEQRGQGSCPIRVGFFFCNNQVLSTWHIKGRSVMLSADILLVPRCSVLISHRRFPCPNRTHVALCSVDVDQMRQYFVFFYDYAMALYMAQVTWRWKVWRLVKSDWNNMESATVG